MSKRPLYLFLIIMMIAIAPGCSDRLDLEESTNNLALGLDLDNENNLLIYLHSPSYGRDIKKKTLEIEVKSQTIRQSREEQDQFAPGVITGKKVQVILIGKRILAHEDWFPILDVFFRDMKNPLTPRVIAFDGSISDIIDLHPKDQPMLPLLLRGMVDTKSTRSETVKTTLQKLHWQMYEKGVTPSISEIQLGNDKQIRLVGITLLDHKGKYTASLSAEETILLQILNKNAKKPVSLSLPIPGQKKSGPFHTDHLSISVQGTKPKIKTSYTDNKFRFDINIKMTASLTERLFPFDVRKNGKELEIMISEHVQMQFENLIKMLQKHQIDPIGLGLYARAHEYSQYKKVEDHWGEALSEADIHVSVKVILGSMGPLK
ncbi:Ger(x)C family spore germination protein [Paenibacillus qinlingensis]|uniref:Ger(x)C family spore germination protein n=1 Tax=Paenibacillus qinlingensis TaxID=1837343 RepID=UPI001565574E|nr:Ger(x)C family spore germination protein [Paenibacillus qinlingensis]NQX62796.1 Ger(x)C family spore germination protein [Paenibacillus qinlingensis]